MREEQLLLTLQIRKQRREVIKPVVQGHNVVRGAESEVDILA